MAEQQQPLKPKWQCQKAVMGKRAIDSVVAGLGYPKWGEKGSGTAIAS